MESIKKNIFDNSIKKTTKKPLLNFIFFIYEILPLIFLSSYSIKNSNTAVNYLGYFLKYFSSHYHIELLNFYFKNSCPWANLDTNNTASQKFLVKKSLLENLSLDINYCKINETLYIIIFFIFFLILPIIYIIFTQNIFNTHMTKSTKRIITICVNLIFIFLRPMALWFFLILMQSIIYFLYGTFQDTTLTLSFVDYFYFYLSILSFILFTYLSHFYIKTIRFHEGVDFFNYKTKISDYFLLFLKILFSIHNSLRKMMFNELADKILILFQILVLSLFIYQIYIEETVSNFRMNRFKKFLVLFSAMMIIVNYINFYFEIYLLGCVILEHIIILLVSIVYYFYPESYLDFSFISHTGKFIYEKSFNAFVLESLKYIHIYKEKLQKLKNKINSEEVENDIIKENLNLLNLHYWNCNLILNDEKCPLCEVHRSGVIDNFTDSNLTEILLNDHLLLKGLMKFINMIEKNILVSIENSNFIIRVGEKEIQPIYIGANIDPVDFFYLKYSLLLLTENRLNRMIFTCSLTQNKYRKNFYMSLYTHFLKLITKKQNKELFEDYEKIRLDEELTTHYNNILNILSDLLEDIELKEFNYTLLLNKYISLGDLNKTIKRGLKRAQKNKKNANRVDLIIKNSVYNFIFNTYIETYPDCLVDLVDHTRYLELRFMKDNILTINFSLVSKELIICKIPTDENLTSFFTLSDLNKDFDKFFPKEIRKSEKSKFIENILQNKTNYFNFDTFLVDKEFFIYRMNLKIKIFLTIENSFKIFVSINRYEENNFFILLKNGRLCSVSQEFYKKFSIHPYILNKKLNLSIFQLIYEINELRLQNNDYNLSDHEEFNLEIDFSQYMLNLEKNLNSVEDEAINNFKKIPGTQKNLISEQIYLSSSRSSLKLISFKQIDKIIADVESGEVLIYTFNKKSNKERNIEESQQESKLIYQSHFDENEEKRNEEFSNYRAEMEIENNKSISDNSNSSTQSFMKKKEEKNYNLLHGLNKNFNKYQNNFKRMKNFCHYIIIINIAIFIIGLSFLFLVNFQLIEIDSNFQILHSFMNESWNLYSSYLSLLSFVTIKSSSNSISRDKDQENSDFGISKYVYKNSSYKFDSAKYFRKNLAYILDDLHTSIKLTYKYAGANYFNQNINFISELFFFSNSDKRYTLEPKDMSKLLEIYENLIHSIIYDSNMYYRIEIINMSNNQSYISDISKYFKDDQTKNQVEKILITIIINYYKNLQSNFNNIFSKQENNLTELVSILSYTNYIGLGIAFFLTLIIFLMTYLLIKVYTNQVKIVMNVILNLSNENRQNMKKKLKLVRKLLNGVSNPLTVIEKLKTSISKLKSQFNIQYVSSTTQNGNSNKSYKTEISNSQQIEAVSKKNDSITPDEFFISKKFIFIFCLMFLILSIYFTIAFIIFYYNDKIMYQRIDLNFAFLKNLKFPLDQLAQLKTTLLLNKTNLNDNYFTQKISLDDYFLDVENFNFRENSIKKIIKNGKEFYINDFLNKLSQNNVCQFLKNLHSKNYKENKEFSLNDFLNGFEDLCKEFSILKTDFFSIIELLNRNIRDSFFSYYYSVKSTQNLKYLLDSKKISDINIIQCFIINPLFSYIIDNVLSPGFESDFSRVLLDCIVVLIFNILSTVGFYLVINRMILSKAIDIGNNLNTLINIIN